MSRLASRAPAVAAIVAGMLLVVGGLAPRVAAQGPDQSDVVLVFDFSASILRDSTNRNRFGAALERIAARVDEISADLIAGDTTVSFVQFATRATDRAGCVDLRLLQSPPTVSRFAQCLRAVAAAYRKGLDPALTKKIGVDTNYVAAMTTAARHLPADAERPALILFTDGKHDVKGVPVSQVLPTRDRLFGDRSPFALLPVGMGLDPRERAALTAGLERLRVIRDMPACASGATFDWPQVTFQTADEAGNAVAVALQDATCTFTVAPTPTPTPAPTPAPVRGIRLTPGDGRIDIVWSRPTAADKVPVVDYTTHCRAADGSGDWITSTEGVSLATTATVEGLTNGVPYICEVAALGAGSTGLWTPAPESVTPIGRPSPPPKPSVIGLNRAVQLSVPAQAAGVDQIQYECSGDNGASWPAKTDSDPEEPTATIFDLANGVDYVCRAFAANIVGISDASPLSDAVRPCGSTLECNPILLPAIGGLLGLLLVGILVAVILLYRGRTTGYVIAVVDVVHTANIGHGSTLGITFVRAEDDRTVTGIVAARGRKAEVRIRRLRGERFAVRDRNGRRLVGDGDAIVITDTRGVRHSLVLRAFATNAASEVARGR
jgi:Fibronectin type III domain